MPNPNDLSKIKVCIVTISLSQGGAERSTALLSKMLVKEGFNVSTVILNDSLDYPYAGNIVSLNVKPGEKDNKLTRLIRFKQLLAKEKFDYIIDNRTRISTLKEFL